ncbi:MAG TPA: SUMF1/EgtB/PvdO family nonheme iron enzyme [Terriglobales bacterium]|nr:SUMF1/EgtB/PvdO family nonheme iron enzyme [Terriglobales bacterium]
MTSPAGRWRHAQTASDQLWPILRSEAITERPVPERHRLIFYLGHLEAFDWNLLAPVLDLEAFHPDWDKLFAFGIDPIDGALPNEPASAWPGRAEVEEYGRTIRKRLASAVSRLGPDPELEVRLEVALEHRWMHIETLAYLIHNLAYELKHPPLLSEPDAEVPARPGYEIEVAAGAVTLGKNPGSGFGWDNEFNAQTVQVGGFAAGNRKVTNGEYLRFVEAGAAAPHFWERRNGAWWQRGMFRAVPLPLEWPVYVTHSEASAYAAWAGRRLPSEAEWGRMAHTTPEGEEREYPWGGARPESAAGNFDLRRWDPVPTPSVAGAASAWGIEDLVGNGWEWTSTVFGPLPGFQAFDFYPGYSANFFDGQHFVLKGGSPRTAACLLRRTFRNWFQPRYPYAYAGFRCVA